MDKAKKFDRIKSFNYSNLPEYGYFVGMVTDVAVDAKDGVEYVYFTAILENRKGESRDVFKQKMKVPQNGTKTWTDGFTNNIEIF